MSKKLKCWRKRYFVIDESRRIQSGVRGFSTKRKAEKIKNSLIKERSKKGQARFNREFDRSLNLKVESGMREVACKR